MPSYRVRAYCPPNAKDSLPMKRLLLVGVLTAAVLVSVAAAASAAPHTLRGTVVAKDRAHRALVVALPGGSVQTLLAPDAFGRTDIGRRVVIRYTGLAGRLPVALGVSLKGQARHAVVRGTIVRLVKRHAIINAGGSVLDVTLKAPKGQRTAASANESPAAGDTVKVQVDIDDDGSLDASTVVVASAPPVTTAGSEGRMEVRGRVTVLSPLTVETGGTPAVSVGCIVPPGFTPNVIVGDMIELRCDLIAGVWTVRVAHDEGSHSSAGDDSAEVEVRGTLAFSTDGNFVIVTPPDPGSAATCAIPPGISLSRFLGGDTVKVECVMSGGVLTLKEIEKKGGAAAQPSSHGDDAHGDSHDGEQADRGEGEK